MKSYLFAPTLLGVALLVTRADVHISFPYDSVAAGSLASQFDTDPLSTRYAVYAPDVDLFGSDIPGTERWRPDLSAPGVTVDDPTLFGAPAPSPANALNARFQPVLLDSALALTDMDFSIQLDGDSFGDASAQILFLDAAGMILQTLAADQTQAGAILSLSGLNGVRGIVLPAGAFYDNLVINAVPEGTASWAIAAIFGVVGWQAARRRRVH